MGIRFACHACDQKLNIKRELAGRRGICPSCAVRFRIPMQDSEISTPIEEESSSNLVALGSEPVGQSTSSQSQSPAAPPPLNLPTTILDDESEGTWYVRPPSGGQYGPATTDLLKQWIDEGRVAATALIWRDGWPQWRSASEALPELVAKLPENEVSSSNLKDERQPAGPIAPLPVKDAAARNSPAQTGATSPAAVNAVLPASPNLVGEATVGTNRRKRSNRRVYVIGILTALAASLIAALIFVSNR